MELTQEQARLALQRALALVQWMEDRRIVLQDEIDVMVEVPARLLRDIRKSLGDLTR